MKNLTVRLSDLDHNRLNEQANKRGVTVSDAVRDIVTQFFEKQAHAQNEKTEHEKTRAKFSDIDNALAEQVQDIMTIKNGLNQLTRLLSEYVKANAGGQR